MADGAEVKIHYTLSVDGKTVDSSRNSAPLSFVCGTGQIIPGLEEQLKGLHVGDKKSVTVPPEKAYGPVRPEAVQKVPMKNFKGGGELKVGSTVTAQRGGRTIQAKVVAVDKKEVTLDLNHPLAGKTLNFDIEVVSITPPANGAMNRP
ncbi:MAG: peptidylprolyl isomerase [Elusimicrobia bacterium]|nr:peptidylprolyl isomerase [Elusimicrobiota bacterium]